MDKVFTWIWRINGVLFMLGALLIIGAVVRSIIPNRTSPYPIEPVVTNIAADPEGKEKWVLDRPQYLTGSDTAFMKLVSENHDIEAPMGKLGMLSFFGDYSPQNAKNILFLNERTGSTRWLFDNVNQLVLSVVGLPNRAGSSYPGNANAEEQAVKLVTYLVVSGDTDGDGKINATDNASLAISDIGGENYRVVVDKVERIISTNLLDDDTLSLIYQIDGSVFHLNYSVNTYAVISNVELPPVGQP